MYVHASNCCSEVGGPHTSHTGYSTALRKSITYMSCKRRTALPLLLLPEAAASNCATLQAKHLHVEEGSGRMARAAEPTPVTHARRSAGMRVGTRGWRGVFYLGRYALKTYVRVRESSNFAMCGLAWAKTCYTRFRIWGVTDVRTARLSCACTCTVRMVKASLSTSATRRRA